MAHDQPSRPIGEIGRHDQLAGLIQEHEREAA
jgi:hypothetical protein